MPMRFIRLCIILGLSVFLLLPGCTTRLESIPPRTAKEQIMLSYAVRDAMSEWNFGDWSDQRVYLDVTNLESIDRGFIVGEVRDWIGRQEAILVNDPEEAEVRLELRSAGVGLESEERLIGIPSFALPLPGAAPVQTPELVVYKDRRRKGVAALAVTGFDTETDRRLFGPPPRIGQTFQANAQVLFIPVYRARHNIPAEVDLSHPDSHRRDR